MFVRVATCITFVCLLLFASVASAGSTRALATATLTVRLEIPAIIKLEAPCTVELVDGKGLLEASISSNAGWSLDLFAMLPAGYGTSMEYRTSTLYRTPLECSTDGGFTWQPVCDAGSTIMRGCGSAPNIGVLLRGALGYGKQQIPVGLIGTVEG